MMTKDSLPHIHTDGTFHAHEADESGHVHDHQHPHTHYDGTTHSHEHVHGGIDYDHLHEHAAPGGDGKKPR